MRKQSVKQADIVYPNVLLVEDDKAFLNFLTDFFQSQSYSVIGTTNARSAITILRRKPVNLIVTDLELPGMSGLEFLEFVHHHYPHISKIVISGKGRFEEVVKAIQFEIVSYLTKPIRSLSILEEAVKKGINRAQTYQEKEGLVKEIDRLRSALRETEDRIQRLEARIEHFDTLYHTLFENSPDGVLMLDEELNVVEVNQNACQLLGLTRLDLYGNPLTQHLSTHLADVIPLIISLFKEPSHLSPLCSIPQRDGSTKMIEIQSVTIRQIVPHRHLLYLKDVTEYHRHLDALHDRLLQAENSLTAYPANQFQWESGWSAFLDSPNVAILIFDTQVSLIEWNLTAEKLTGYSKNAVFAHTNLASIFPLWNELIYPLITQEVLQEGKSLEGIEVEAIAASGDHVYLRWNISPLRWEGKIIGAMVVAMNISQEHQLRKALEDYSHQLELLASERTRDLFQSQERFRHLFENNRDALFAADSQGAITEVNSAWLKLLGYSSRWDALGKHFLYDFISHRSLADRIMKTLVARQMVEDELITIRRPDGKEISALLTVSANPHPTTSLPTFEGVIRDVTQLKALEERLVEHSLELERLVSERSQQLADSESKLRRLMENSPDILYRLNFPIQRFEFISPAVYSITGYRPEEIISLGWEGFLGLIHPDDQGEYLRLFSRLTRKGRYRGSERFTIGFRMRRKDGDWIWLEDHGSALRKWDGSLEAIEGVIRDVTIQRKAEHQLTRQAEILEAEVQRRTAELKESESRYRLLLSEAGDIIFTCDAQGQILEMNRRGEEMFGKSVEEINRIGLFSLLDEFSRRKFRRALRVCFQKGLKTDPFPIEYPTPSGGRLYLEIQTTPILLKGKVSMALNVCRDLTARRKAAEALRALKSWSENIVHSINEGIFIEDNEGVCEYVNPAMERMLGFSAKEMIGKHWSAFVPPEKIDELARQTDIRKLQGWNRYEAILLSAEGEKIPVLISSRNRISDGEILGGISVVSDLRQFKEMERRQRFMENLLAQERKLSDIGLKAAGIAHNIANPLGVIMGYSESLWLKHPELTPLKTIIDQAQRIADIIENILVKSRQQQDKARKPIDLNELLQTELKFLEANLFFKHQVEKIYHFDPQLPKIEGIWSELSQAILNIVDNALDAMHDSPQKKLRIQTSYKEQAILIEIEDTGPGIPSEILPHIFDPFFTTKPLIGESTEDRPTGTGLGLSTSQQIIAQYGGHIEVESQEKVGTLFRIVLPTSAAFLTRSTTLPESSEHMG